MTTIKKYCGLLLGLIFVPLNAHSQDVIFTQPLATLLYTNPAYSGALSNYRIGAAIHSQLSSSANPYNTFYADFDIYVPSIQSGFGIYVMNDHSFIWQSTSAALSYAYAFHLSEQIIARPAIQAVYHRQQQSSQSLTFPDGINGTGTSIPVIYPAQNEAFQDVDFATGLLLSHPLWETGFSVGHIGAKNNDSLMVYANRPLKLTVHGHGSIPLLGTGNLQSPDLADWNTFSDIKLLIDATFSYQKNYRIIIAGVAIQTGALYGGLNFKSTTDFETSCIGLTLGLSSNKLKIGYNADIMAFGSQLRGWNSASHEIYVHFGFGETTERPMKSGKRTRKKSNCIGCPY